MEINIDSLDFTKFTIKDANGNTEEFDIRDELRISENTISDDLMNQASKYAYWASILERVRANAESEQRQLDKVSAKLNLQVRQQYDSQGKKPTKDMIESAITLNDLYQQQASVVDAWNYRTRQLHYIVKAFEARKDMAIQISAELRQTNKNGGITNPFAH